MVFDQLPQCGVAFRNAPCHPPGDSSTESCDSESFVQIAGVLLQKKLDRLTQPFPKITGNGLVRTIQIPNSGEGLNRVGHSRTPYAKVLIFITFVTSSRRQRDQLVAVKGVVNCRQMHVTASRNTLREMRFPLFRPSDCLVWETGWEIGCGVWRQATRDQAGGSSVRQAGPWRREIWPIASAASHVRFWSIWSRMTVRHPEMNCARFSGLTPSRRGAGTACAKPWSRSARPLVKNWPIA